MKILHSWLLDFIETEKSPSELADVLTNTGAEVNALHTVGFSSEHVVVGKILSSEKHPQADRLRVCQVLTGEAEPPRQIVCGAKNFAVGDHVPVALPGAVLPGDFAIKKSKLRGVTSEGMMCSAKELALAEDAEGLLILSQETKIGERVDHVFPRDSVYEIEVTSNRPDLLSHRGVAREFVAAGVAHWKNQREFVSDLELKQIPLSQSFGIFNEVKSFCPLYTATIFRGLNHKNSPLWMKRRLEAVGLRPINALVDITNYLMHHIGQPMHVFDLDKLAGDCIVIRRAKSGEALKCLDGSRVELTSQDYVIADAYAPVALAGVVGGANSGVTSETKNVVLEVAYFDAKCVRAMSARHRVSTDSSYRFERGVDPELPRQARRLALQMFDEILSAQASGFIEIDEMKLEPPIVTLRHARVKRVLGKALDESEVHIKLAALGLKHLQTESSGRAVWQVPSYRLDLSREADLIEEVARLTSFESIPSVNHFQPAPASDRDLEYDQILVYKRTLVGMGWHEVLLPPLTTGPGAYVMLTNPLSSDQTALRSELLPQLLKVLARNIDAGNTGCKLFTIEKVFSKAGEESLSLALVAAGLSAEDNWAEPSRHLDAFDIKAAIKILGLPTGQQIRVLSPTEAKHFGLKGPVAVAEITLPQATLRSHKFSAWSAYPSVRRDLSLIAEKSIPAGEVVDAVMSENFELLEKCWVFDVFTDESGSKVPLGCKSLSLALVFRAPDRTLTEDEVNLLFVKILERVKNINGVAIR